MKAAKTDVRKAQELKAHLIKNQLMDFDRRNTVENGKIIFPITADFEMEGVEIIESNLPKKHIQKNWKEILEEKLSKEEMNILKTAHDVVGTIAILEIPPELESKEKLIGETLLQTNKNLKTILKKAGEHEGIFRTQKMKLIAGVDTKETIHKENNAQILLDVEEIFFSARLSTERKRIMKQVKDGEDVLVMFSGAAPYPVVLSRNTNARRIIGIEINPKGHECGLKNLKLNKTKNVVLINGDVKEIMPNIYKHLVGLKTAMIKKEAESRLAEKPKIMEFHLFDKDLEDGGIKLEKWVKEYREKGLEVIIHQPFRKANGEYYDFSKENPIQELKYSKIIGDLCKKYDCKSVVHTTNCQSKKEDEEVLIENLKKLREYYNYFYFENETPEGIYYKTEDIIRISRKAGLKNLCIDITHLYIVYEDNNKVEEHIQKIQKEFRTYFHISDHNKKTHTCEIGKGFIDFNKVMPYVTSGVTEVKSLDEVKATEMINSYRKVINMIPTFDRILMPLPKSAEEFLETAFKVAKKGTIFHFYDFLHESEFEKCEEKVAKACKLSGFEYKKLDFVKCGQYSPGKFRVCLDFEITKV